MVVLMLWRWRWPHSAGSRRRRLHVTAGGPASAGRCADGLLVGLWLLVSGPRAG